MTSNVCMYVCIQYKQYTITLLYVLLPTLSVDLLSFTYQHSINTTYPSTTIGHPFWGSNADSDDAPTNLPPQPAFESYIRSVVLERAKDIEANAMDEYGLIYNTELEEYVYENNNYPDAELPPPPMSTEQQQQQHRHKSNKPEVPQSPTSHHTLYHAEGR